MACNAGNFYHSLRLRKAEYTVPESSDCCESSYVRAAFCAVVAISGVTRPPYVCPAKQAKKRTHAYAIGSLLPRETLSKDIKVHGNMQRSSKRVIDVVQHQCRQYDDPQ